MDKWDHFGEHCLGVNQQGQPTQEAPMSTVQEMAKCIHEYHINSKGNVTCTECDKDLSWEDYSELMYLRETVSSQCDELRQQGAEICQLKEDKKRLEEERDDQIVRKVKALLAKAEINTENKKLMAIIKAGMMEAGSPGGEHWHLAACLAGLVKERDEAEAESMRKTVELGQRKIKAYQFGRREAAEEIARLLAENKKFRLALQYIADDSETQGHPEYFGMNRLAGYAKEALSGSDWLDEFGKDDLTEPPA